ncbi:hypothetical protein GXW82_15455 [Streptacidiphilus sp. 4-A2]|nr:hypothetical protein [Streptacidiphilus sp. 4-A2]
MLASACSSAGTCAITARPALVRFHPIADKDVIMRSRIPGLKALVLPAAIAVSLCGLAAAGPAQAEAPANAAPRPRRTW